LHGLAVHLYGPGRLICLICSAIFVFTIRFITFRFHITIISILFLLRCWCEPRDHVVTWPTIKINIRSRKVEIGLIGVWHNGNLPQGTNTIEMSRMTPQNQLIFDKSESVLSRTEECKNHSHTLKLKNSEVIIIKAAEILAYMSLNSSWKINHNGPLMWTYMRSTQNWSQKAKIDLIEVWHN